MTPAIQLLTDLRSRGLDVTLDLQRADGILAGPQARLTAMDRRRLADLKPQVLTALRAEAESFEVIRRAWYAVVDETPDYHVIQWDQVPGYEELCERWLTAVYRRVYDKSLTEEECQECFVFLAQAFAHWYRYATEPEDEQAKETSRVYFNLAANFLSSEA